MRSPARPSLNCFPGDSGARRPRARIGRPGLCAAAAGLVLGLAFAQSSLADERLGSPGAPATPASVAPSSAASDIVAWVRESADNQGLPFLVIDKVNAQVLVFDRDGELRGGAPALLGLAKGDISPPGIGDRPLSGIGPEDRITPAGRFVASLGENLSGKGILWLDYDAALSLHPVVTTRAADRRLERLSTVTAEDNRISYGCVNVPAKFYQEVVQAVFSGTTGIVYILPEVRSIEQLFPRASAAAAAAREGRPPLD